MKIELQLFATLASFLPAPDAGGRVLIDVPETVTVTDVLASLGVPATVPRIVLVNGHDVEESVRLAPGDVLSVFPPLAGGS